MRGGAHHRPRLTVAEGLDEDVRPSAQPPQSRRARRPLEVERQGALAAALHVDRHGGAGRSVDPHHASPEVGQDHAAERGRSQPGQLQHPQPAQRHGGDGGCRAPRHRSSAPRPAATTGRRLPGRRPEALRRGRVGSRGAVLRPRVVGTARAPRPLCLCLFLAAGFPASPSGFHACSRISVRLRRAGVPFLAAQSWADSKECENQHPVYTHAQNKIPVVYRAGNSTPVVCPGLVNLLRRVPDSSNSNSRTLVDEMIKTLVHFALRLFLFSFLPPDLLFNWPVRSCYSSCNLCQRSSAQS